MVLENVTSDFLAGGNSEGKMAGQVAFSPSVALQHLQQTANALQDLQLLASKFMVKVELSQYTQEDKELVVAALLDCLMCGEEVAPFMNGFLSSYLIRHQLHQDRTLAHYTLETLANADQDWWAWQEAPWEDKLYAIINVMSDAQVRAECLLECLRVAPVPWSQGTQAGCELGLSLNTSLSSQLKEQRNMVGLKLVLRKYSLHMTNIYDVKNAKMILRSILRHDEACVMVDAMCVVNTYKHLSQVDAYFFRAVHLLTTRNTDGIEKLLLDLNENIQKQICQRLVTYITETLLLPPRGKKGRDLHLAVTEGVMALQAVLRRWVEPAGPAGGQDLFSAASYLHTLQVHYNLFPTLKEIDEKKQCKALLHDQVTAWYRENVCDFHSKEQATLLEDKNKMKRKSFIRVENPTPTHSVNEESSSVWSGLNRLQWLASLLGVARTDLLSFLALLSSRNNRMEEAIQICQEIMADPAVSDCSGVVCEVVRLVVEQQSHSGASFGSFPPCPNSSTTLQEKEFTIKSRASLINIVYELVCSSLLSTHPDFIGSLLEFGTWCQLGQVLYSQCHVEGVYSQNNDLESSNPYSKWRFSPLFCDANIPIEDCFVVPVLSQAMDGCLKSHHCLGSTNFIPYQDNKAEIANLEERKYLDDSLQELVRHLRERGQDLLALLMPLQVQQWQATSQAEGLLVGHSPDWQQVFTILLKVLGTSKPDITLAISLLLLLGKKDALKVLNELIKRYGFDYSKLMSVAAVGRDLCSFLGRAEVKEQFEVLLMRAQWGKRLGDMNITFKEAFKGDSVHTEKVINDLVSHPSCTFTILYDYCEDFKIDVTDSLLCYLQTTLHSWSPLLPSEGSLPGEVVHVELPRAVLSKCQAIIAEVKNKTLLYQMLLSELDMMSSYNYELIQLVLQQLIVLEDDPQELQLQKRGLDVISFLKEYTRRAVPSNTEIDDWIDKYPQSLGVPEIAKHRLPFHYFFKQTKLVRTIVEAEVDVSTLDTWLNVSHLMKLNSDHLCFMATENTVSRMLEPEASERHRAGSTTSRSPHWRLHCTHTTLLSKVHAIIFRMQNYELAAACANWVINRLPPGADKVTAAQKSSLLVREWKEQTSDPKAATAFVKMDGQYQQLACEHTLHKHGLAQPEYLALTRTPLDLVSALYQHPSLSSLTSLCTHSLPDINGCVSELCSVAGLNETAIHIELLEKWLPPPEAEGGDTDETVANFKVVLDPTITTDQSDTNDIMLSRVIYLLQSCPQEETVSYLLNRALSEDTGVSTTHRLRALRCLLAVGDEATIQKHYTKGVSCIRSLLKTMTYVSRLEDLGHASSVQQFNNVDKSALVEGLWHSQRHNPAALCLITDLCHDYKVTAASLWGALLTQLNHFVKCGQVEVRVMERVLLQLKSVPHLWVVPALTAAWTTLVSHPFTKAVAPVTEDSLAKCVHSVDLLLRHCPVMVDTAPLLQHCAALHLPVLALAIAAADQVELHDLQSMAEKADPDTLKDVYLKLKPVFSFPRRVEELLDALN